MQRFWIMLKKNNRIIRDTVITAEMPTDDSGFIILFEQIGQVLDVPSPLMLGKHWRELDQFNRTRFFPDDFLESITFDWMEIEILVDKSKSRRV